MSRKDNAVAYPAARMVDMGVPDQRVASETGAPRALVRDMRINRVRNANDPMAPGRDRDGDNPPDGTRGPQRDGHGTGPPAGHRGGRRAGPPQRDGPKGTGQRSRPLREQPGASGRARGVQGAGAPRMATQLVAQACGTGYVAGTDDGREAELILASVMIAEDTTLIRLTAEAGDRIVAEATGRDELATGDWPSSRTTYMEFESPITARAASPAMALEGVLVGRPDDSTYRNVVVLLSRDGLITNHTFDLDPREGVPRPTGRGPAPPDDHNTVGRLIMALLSHVTGGDGHLRPATMSRAERRRAARGERAYQWLEVAPPGAR